MTVPRAICLIVFAPILAVLYLGALLIGVLTYAATGDWDWPHDMMR